MEAQKHAEIVTKLKIIQSYCRAIKSGTEQSINVHDEHMFVMKSGGCRRYVDLVDCKYAGIVYAAKKILALFHNVDIIAGSNF